DVAGAAREAAGVQAADGLELSVGVVVRERLQRRLRCGAHGGGAAVRHGRIQLQDGKVAPAAGPGDRSRRRHGLGDVHAGETGPERVRARGRRRLPRLFLLFARTGRPLGHVPVARPRPHRAQRGRGGHLVAPPRRVHGLSEVVAVVAHVRDSRFSQRMAFDRTTERGLLGGAALLFAARAAGPIVWCTSMSAMAEMPMPGGWTMSMAWMRMPGQTWPCAAASFLGMWVVMMVAMMLPSLVPMLRRYREAVGRTGETRLGRLSVLV